MAARDPNYVEPPTSKKAKEDVPYYKYAFHNVYNYTLLGGVASAAALTGNWWLAVAGAGAEALWMLFGPDSRLLRKLVFDKVHDERLQAAQEAARAKLLASLPVEDRARVDRMARKHDDILRLSQENESLSISGEILGGELRKLDEILDSFVELVVGARKYRDYLETVDLDQLEKSIRQQQSIVQGSSPGGNDERRELAQKNLAILMKRKEKLGEIRQFILKAMGQMDLIENTFRLLADQIVTMRSVQEMGGQLDGLMDGVEAVQSTARETAAMLQNV